MADQQGSKSASQAPKSYRVVMDCPYASAFVVGVASGMSATEGTTSAATRYVEDGHGTWIPEALQVEVVTKAESVADARDRALQIGHQMAF